MRCCLKSKKKPFPSASHPRWEADFEKMMQGPGDAAPVLQAVTEVEVNRVFGDPELLRYKGNAIFQVKDPAVT